MANFLHNKTITKVSLLDGRITLDVGQSLPITDIEAEHDDVIYAKRKGWVTVETSVDSATPAPAAVKGPVPEKNPMEGSLTIPTKTVAAEPVAEDTSASKPAKKAGK